VLLLAFVLLVLLLEDSEVEGVEEDEELDVETSPLSEEATGTQLCVLGS
jgi:hypothetical protein